jgi:hypothetical protein
MHSSSKSWVPVVLAAVLVMAVVVVAGCASGQKSSTLRRESPPPLAMPPLEPPTGIASPTPSPSPMPSCLPTTGKDDAALASWIHDGGQPGHKADVGVFTLLLPELTPPPCTPLTLRVSVFKVTVRAAASGADTDYSFSASSVNTFTVPYDGHLKDFGNYKKIGPVSPLDMKCVGGMEVLYTGSSAMKVAELPKTLETSSMGPIVDHFGGRVPADSFQTKRVIVASLDQINVLGC